MKNKQEKRGRKERGYHPSLSKKERKQCRPTLVLCHCPDLLFSVLFRAPIFVIPTQLPLSCISCHVYVTKCTLYQLAEPSWLCMYMCVVDWLTESIHSFSQDRTPAICDVGWPMCPTRLRAEQPLELCSQWSQVVVIGWWCHQFCCSMTERKACRVQRLRSRWWRKKSAWSRRCVDHHTTNWRRQC